MRIAIVNDEPLAVQVLQRVILLSSEHQVAWIAGSGEEAVAKCAKDLPDLILMDLILPGMDGVETTRRIMSASPCAILVVTFSVERNAARVFEALGAGALDAVDTPSGAPDSASPLFAKLKMVHRLIGDCGHRPPRFTAPTPGRRLCSVERRSLVAVGSSAGGPNALATVLQGLPADFMAAVVIVQHMDAQFAPGLAAWLADQCQLPVRIARAGDQPQPGAVLVAGTNDHLQCTDGGTLGYTAEPRQCSYRPSVDVFFESVVRHWTGETIGVLLTGMGRDGAAGLRSLREAGEHTIAQDRKTSAVYGMPKAAAELDAAVEILPLEKIAPALLHHFALASPVSKPNQNL